MEYLLGTLVSYLMINEFARLNLILKEIKLNTQQAKNEYKYIHK